jgi:plasmid stabilization system protein ParE
MNEYSFHPDALLDIEDICDFLAQDSIDAAHQVIDQLIEKIELAAQFPTMGHLNPDLTSLPLRFLHVHDYVIAYAQNEVSIWVTAVVHGSAIHRSLLPFFGTVSETHSTGLSTWLW